MSEHDHFDEALDDHSGQHHETDVVADAHDVVDAHVNESAPAKRKIPPVVMMIGAALLFGGAMAGYKHFTKPKQNDQFAASQVNSLPAEGGMMQTAPATQQATSALPAATTQNAGLDASQPAAADQLPAAVTSTAPATALAQLDSQPASAPATAQASEAAKAPAVAAASMPSAPATAPAPAKTTQMSAAAEPPSNPSSTATDDKDQEIASLKKELSQVRAQLAHTGHTKKTPRVARDEASAEDGTHASVDTVQPSTPKKVVERTHTRSKHKGERVEYMLGYRIKQVIPGQGWVQNEETGKQQVVTIGDKIGTAEVTKIDPDNSLIYTSAGIIQ